ncbi:hypothetical protein DESUT3_24750 [Desulfuromonas versatilis]|uniref:Uncharacterized protein n=1 Tax=Desulfuromonas versatilis TaxID=2802975 RepID=A0ABM8HXZ9_9BACT|nr:hypothetical protein DESUT3_24750 [Desulfuromonas versatilis]
MRVSLDRTLQSFDGPLLITGRGQHPGLAKMEHGQRFAAGHPGKNPFVAEFLGRSTPGRRSAGHAARQSGEGHGKGKKDKERPQNYNFLQECDPRVRDWRIKGLNARSGSKVPGRRAMDSEPVPLPATSLAVQVDLNTKGAIAG